jgi:MFS superfamily sulfate permease-like transporter
VAAAVATGQVVPVAAAVGGGCLLTILLLRHWLPAAPGVLVAVLGGAAAAWAVQTVGEPVPELLGSVPSGLPVVHLPLLSWQEVGQLLPAAAAIAVVSAADTAVLSRALHDTRDGVPQPNRELAAVGVANLLAGLLQGFPVSSSSTRTPVAMAAGSRSQLTGLVAAACVGLLLVAAPRALALVPRAALAAVVIAAAVSLLDLPGLVRLARQRAGEFAVSLVCLAGVIFVGVVPGIGLAVLLAVGEFVWRAWQPYSAVLGRLPGRKGYHDISRHPEAHQVPGLVLFRWDSPLFFANAEIFRSRLLAAVAAAEQPLRRIVVAAEPVTDIDVTAADMLQDLKAQLADRGISLCFAELKGPVKDRLRRYGLYEAFRDTGFYPTIGSAVRDHLQHERLEWRDPLQRPRETGRKLTS